MKAIATLLYSPEYLAGALVLGHTLRKFSLPDTKLVILIDSTQFDSSQLSALRKLWDILEDTHILESHLTNKLTVDLKRPELGRTFTKIQLWKLPYDTVLYLDADTLPIVGTRNVTDLLKLNFPVNKIVASPDSGFPDVFNSGVFMLHPNEADYQNLSQLVLSGDEDISFDGADQGLLNQYFNAEPDWVARHVSTGNATPTPSTAGDSNWIHIPFLYNTTPNSQYEYVPASNHFGPSSWESSSRGQRSSENVGGGHTYVKSVTSPYYNPTSPYGDVSFEHFSSAARSQVKLIHYIGPVKPWNAQPTGVFEKWWNEWFDYSGGKSIHDAIDHGSRPKETPTKPVPAAKITPSELCNPENYKQFTSNHVSSANSWDAAKDPPPSETPKLDKFEDDLKTFQSSWNVDRPDPPTCSKAQASDGIRPVSTVVEGNHNDQVPERVFDDNYDYVPEHLLMKENSEFEATNEYKEILKEESLDEEEENELETIEQCSDVVQDSVHAAQQYPKIFPWEFKENNAPTRSWD